MFQLYVGNGKGKTTAAVGCAVRCAGSNHEVLFTQFLKDGSSGEISALAQMEHVQVFLSEGTVPFLFQITDEEREKLAERFRTYFDEIREKVRTQEFQMIVLDEIVDACNAGILSYDEFLDFLDQCPDHMEVIATGRDPAPALIHRADYVSDIIKIKHPYDEGTAARRGIEY